MPWKVYKQEDRFCVHKEQPDGSKGELVACHESEEKAKAQLRALYASESKETNIAETIDRIKSILVEDEDVPESVQAVIGEYITRKEAAEGLIESDEPPAVDKEASASEDEGMKLVDKLKTLTGTISSALSSIFRRPDNSDMMIWKEQDGSYRWVGRYSNNFRDNDSPAEIIAADSHREFAELVDKGLEPAPELWIWHVKDLRIGVSDWVAYDDAGFALAGGHSLPGTEEIFEKLTHVKDIAMSHGMPEDSIERDEKDQTIIVRHKTREISILPRWSAANKMTGFAVLSKQQEEENMIPSEKREKLAKEWGLSEAQIAALETMNAEDASKAAEAGIESKELKEGEQPVAVTETPVSEGAPTADGAITNPGDAAQAPVVEPATSAPAPLTVEGVQEALRSAFAEAIQPFADKLNALESQVKELSKADEQKIAKEAAGTPMASLAALLGQTVQSAIGNPLTHVDGRTELAKSKPVEADPAAASARTPVPFINDFLAKSQ